jgi:DNA repair protein RAD57
MTLTSQEIAKRAQVPPAEVTKLSEAIVQALQSDNEQQRARAPLIDFSENAALPLKISSLDVSIDALLAGGIRAGYVSEITGERCVDMNDMAVLER